MGDDIAIKVDRVRKDFLLPHERTQSVKSIFVNGLRGKRNKTIQKQHALKDISFEIKKGEFFGIVGRNGSGKSTMLKILAQIYQPTKGSVQVNGRLVPFIELGVGFNPELTGRDNVYLSAALLGFSKKEIDAMYSDIVEFAELEQFMDQKLKNYSSGMQVRLAFSVAVRADAEILLIDEVLAVGDADFQRKCFRYFKKLKKLNKTVVFVTHDMGAVTEYCDRGILINDGVISKQGAPEAVSAEYLKLFNEGMASHTKQATKDNRWGTGTIHIDDVVIDEPDGKIVVTMLLSAKEDHDRVIIGLRFCDAAGRLAVGTSNERLGGSTLSMKAGEQKRLQFALDDILGKGDFTLGATIQLGDKTTICDNWDDIATFKRSTSGTYYPIAVPGTLKEVKL